LALFPGGVIEFIGFDGPLQVAIHLVGDDCIAEPLAPAIAGADIDAQLPRNTMGRTRETQEKGGKDPVCERPLAMSRERLGQAVEGAPTPDGPIAFAH
jgi:hypothetical protein